MLQYLFNYFDSNVNNNEIVEKKVFGIKVSDITAKTICQQSSLAFQNKFCELKNQTCAEVQIIS